MLAKTQKETKQEKVKEEQVANEVTIEDFCKIQLKVGEVKACEAIKKSKKLLKLTVDVAGEERTIVSGIAKSFKPEELVGKQVVVVTNLKKAKLCGVESQGMVLCSEDENGKITLVSPQNKVSSGSEVN